MRGITITLTAAVIGAVVSIAHTFAQTSEPQNPIAQFKIPADYRGWKVISIAREEGKLDDMRVVLGNDLAYEAARDGKASYPEGAIIARIAWQYDLLPENQEAFGRPQAHVPGPRKNGLQFMIKDSRKYAATGGWGYAHYVDGVLANEATLSICYACHEKVKSRDFVFARFAQ